MSEPVAKRGDRVVGIDTHIVQITSPGGPVPTPIPLPFSGPITDNLSSTVFIDNEPAVIVGSVAHNRPPHIPTGGPFQRSPSNRATVDAGSATVFAGNHALARNGDPATCCNDPSDAQTGHVMVGTGTSFSG
ncbi:MAG: PAAR domain-containing protein [Byssovorax sp.]